MGLFDFLKKEEFAKIASLEQAIQQKNTLIKGLEERVADLSKYEDIENTDIAITEKLAQFEVEKQKYIDEKQSLKSTIEELKNQYDSAHKIYLNLKHQNDLFTESLELAEYGVYEPHFDFDTSGTYKDEIFKVREELKQLITSDKAVLGGENITWNNSLSQGQAMVKRQKKLMMRAFNGECDSFIAAVDWNNMQKMEERIDKSYTAINQVYEKQGIRLAYRYKEVKIKELQLSYEYKKKKYDEKEEQREIRERMREEEKVQREIEAVTIKAEKEEAAYQKALEKARKEVQNTVGEKQNELLRQIAELESRLSEAEQNKARAMSMAQQTRRGHVYVISNIGSFGEDVYKIGMTRRLEPMDRVKELGDASVPFSFDVHALIFSEDAPALENTLHKEFENKRVNLINTRREFFNVTLSEIESVVVKNHGYIEFTKLAEAEQYRETVAIRNRLLHHDVVSLEFPSQL